MKRNLRRGGFTLIELAIVLALCGIVAAIFIPMTQKNKRNAQRVSCQSNLKQMGLAFSQYSQDHSNTFPPIALHEKVSGEVPYLRTYGWADTLKTYLHVMPSDMQFFQCPTKPTFRGANATQRGYNDYWFNANLNALPLEEVETIYETFLSGEGNDGHDQSDARYHLDALPQSWLNDPHSPAQRHDGTGNYLFADGHVRSYSPQVVKAENWFAVKAAKLHCKYLRSGNYETKFVQWLHVNRNLPCFGNHCGFGGDFVSGIAAAQRSAKIYFVRDKLVSNQHRTPTIHERLSGSLSARCRQRRDFEHCAIY